jgi:hypothetical protein
MPFLTPKVGFACVPLPAPGAESFHMSYDEWNRTASKLMEPGQQLPECNRSIFTPEVSVVATNETCDAWTYNKTWFRETLTTQFDLVCHRDWLITLMQSLYMASMLLGVLSSGLISDK